MSKLNPKLSIIKKLFALSGNECAFYQCSEKIVNEDSVLVGQVCHIEAQKPHGPRYNKKQTEDERRDFANLIVLCPTHHVIIDSSPEKYTVPFLQDMKTKHEKLNLKSTFVPPKNILNQAIFRTNLSNKPKWLTLLSYTILCEYYSGFKIDVLEREFPDFTISGEFRSSVISQDIDTLGVHGTLYDIRRKITSPLYNDKILMLLFCDEILDSRFSRNNKKRVFRKHARYFLQNLSDLVKEADIDLSIVFLCRENGGFSVLPTDLLMGSTVGEFYEIETGLNLSLDTHLYFERFFMEAN
jgi:hypothetical protein